MDSNTTNNGDNQMNTDTNIPESFKQFLATGSSVIETCRELLAENQRLRFFKEDVDKVFKDHGIMSADNLRLYLEDYASVQKVMEKNGIDDDAGLADALDLAADGKKSDTPSDYQTLKDFKAEMDAIHEEFDIPHDVDALRKELSTLREYRKEMEDRFEDSSIGKLRQVCGEYDAWAGALSDIGESITDADFIEEFPGKWEELAKLEEVASDHDITDASELDDTLTDMENAEAYEKGFNELAEFVEKIKEVIGHCGDDIPATDMEDYK